MPCCYESLKVVRENFYGIIDIIKRKVRSELSLRNQNIPQFLFEISLVAECDYFRLRCFIP
jgi:hypothetical protein